MELNAIISTHVHEDARNRHKATAISVESDVGNASDVASGIYLVQLKGTDNLSTKKITLTK